MKIKAVIFAAALFGGAAAGLAQEQASVTLDGHAVSVKMAPASGKRVMASLQSDADIAFKGVRVPKGSYTLYVLTEGPQWQLAVNKATGAKAAAYDAKLDLGRVNLTMGTGAGTANKIALTKTAALAAKVEVNCNGKAGTVAFHLDRGGNDTEW